VLTVLVLAALVVAQPCLATEHLSRFAAGEHRLVRFHRGQLWYARAPPTVAWSMQAVVVSAVRALHHLREVVTHCYY
jgi:hypothetical protein